MPDMDAPFDLAAARAADRSYQNATDAEYIPDEDAFNRAYTFAAHRSARHLRAALAAYDVLAAENDRLLRQRDEAERLRDSPFQAIGTLKRLVRDAERVARMPLQERDQVDQTDPQPSTDSQPEIPEPGRGAQAVLESIRDRLLDKGIRLPSNVDEWIVDRIIEAHELREEVTNLWLRVTRNEIIHKKSC